MVFSSLTFLLLFLPAVTLLCFLCPGKWRNAFLFAASIVFYAAGQPDFLPLFLAGILWNYLLALGIGKYAGTRIGKWLLLLCIAGDLLLLGWFKYAHFLLTSLSSVRSAGTSVPEITLPLGISFFTFQEISYAVDVYRGAKPEKNPLRTGLYIAFFPQLIAGPIVRYRDFAPQLDQRKMTPEDLGEGFFRFLSGLCKKVLLANHLGSMTDSLLAEDLLSSQPAPLLLLAVFGFALQLYLDFSAYSDMAIGLGRMFGFRLPENFRDPYLAESAAGFWHRWHISLSEWFRDYVYIPMGGGRGSSLSVIRNLLTIWILTGIWHGAGFSCLLWGLIWGILLCAERFLVRPENRSSLFQGIWRVLIVTAAMLLFLFLRLPEPGRVFFVYRQILSPAAWQMPFLPSLTLWLQTEWFWLLGAVFVSFRILRKPIGRIRARHPRISAALPLLASVLLLLGALLSVSYITAGAYNPFLYFQF